MNTNSTTEHSIPAGEYKEIKRREHAEIQAMVDSLTDSPEPRIMYRNRHVVTDLKDMLEYSARHHGDLPLFKQKFDRNEPFREISFSEALDDVNALGTAMIALGLKDKHIGVIGPNCYEWGETYLAITGGTGIVVPLDKELNASELEQLTVKGELSAVITASKKHYEIFKDIKASGGTGLEYVITTTLNDDEDAENGLLSWHALRENGGRMVSNGDRSYIDAQIINTDLAVILFTSGTTGVAKGVMLNNRNLVIDVIVAHSLLEVNAGDRFFSILPMHHTYEATATFLSCVYAGASMCFCQGLKYILKDIEEIKPTLILAVPLIYENFYNKIMRTVRDQGKDKLLGAALRVNRVTSKIGIDISKTVASQIIDTFGGSLRTMISGGAPIDGEIMDFFCDLGFRAVQGYGLTECSPIVALSPDKRKYMKNASAGFLFPLTECRIVNKDDNGIGEICFKGPTVMMGYYKDPDNTAEVLRDGWFYTGDLGYLDKDNYVFITGRKKNVIITGNGKNVFPEELEAYVLRSPYIEECMVWGDEKNDDPLKRGIYATVRINKEVVDESIGPDASGNDVSNLIQREIDRINAELPLFKKINHVVIRDREFDKTTAMKIRRFVEDNKRS